MMIPAIYFVWSMRYAARGVESVALAGARVAHAIAAANVNFEVTPVVTWDAYEFAPREETEIVVNWTELERI